MWLSRVKIPTRLEDVGSGNGALAVCWSTGMTKRGLILCWTLCWAGACLSLAAQEQQSAPGANSQQNQASPNQAQPNSPQPDQNSPSSQTNQTQPSEAPSGQTPQDQSPASSASQNNSQQQNQPQPDQQQTSPQNGQEQQGEGDQAKDIGTQAADATKKFGVATLNKVVDWERGWLTGPYVGRNRELVSVTAQQRREIYLQQTLTTPSAYFKRMFSAAVDQARDAPPQWQEGWAGYGERFASREGQFITANSLAALGNAALKYEPRYDQCKCSGFLHRTRHAILRNFYTYNQSEVERRPQWALYAGAFSAGVIASTWKPHPRGPLDDGVWGMAGQAGYGALLNFFTEFAGEINRKIDAKLKRKR